ncbi:MAG: hypothetical protein ACFFD4_28520 [Candidatus Odinarchaeota archaeon]
MVTQVQTLPTSLELNSSPLKVNNIPKSAQKILEILHTSIEPLDSTKIQIKAQYSMKTTRKSLKLLMSLGVVEKRLSLEDARKSYYKLNLEITSS